jgi:RNA polymerase sigma factor (sigma-70 family)
LSRTTEVEDLLREYAPQVLAVLIRQHGNFDTCEDAVQEALLAASTQWLTEGLPDNPGGWLMTVASRRWREAWRSDAARRRRELTTAALAGPEPAVVSAVDDSLTLLFLCCHPSLTRVSQVALTLRAVGGLTTAEIARAFLVPESTIGQRISRAKQRIKASGAEFRMPSAAERPERIASVMEVLYLIFNEGYTASSGHHLNRVELTAEAIRLTRQLREWLPEDGEVAGLLALMLLTEARSPARTGQDGALIPLAEQDRSRWDADAIAEGVELISHTLSRSPLGPYQLQAAVAAVHDEAPSAEKTDWRQILGLYNLLDSIAPGPMVTLNRIVAFAMINGPEAGLRQLAVAEADPALVGHHRVHAMRAHLLELAGDHQAARAQYELAARGTQSLPEQRYLTLRAARGANRDRRLRS